MKNIKRSLQMVCMLINVLAPVVIGVVHLHVEVRYEELLAPALLCQNQLVALGDILLAPRWFFMALDASSCFFMA